MTDNNSHQEEHEESEPHARIGKDGELEFLDENGNWQKHEWESTGDPEKDRLMEMRASEVDKILEDPLHPLHEKAVELHADMMKPIVESIRRAVFPHGDPLKNLFEPLFEPIASKWLGVQSDAFRNLLGFEFRPSFRVPPVPGWNFESPRRREIEDASEVEDFEEAAVDDESEWSTTLEHSADSVVEPVEGKVVDPVVSAMVKGYKMVADRIDKSTAVMEQWRIDTKQEAEKAGRRSDDALKVAKEANRLAKDSNVLSSEANTHAARANVTAQDSHRLSIWAFVVSAIAALAAVGGWIWG